MLCWNLCKRERIIDMWVPSICSSGGMASSLGVWSESLLQPSKLGNYAMPELMRHHENGKEKKESLARAIFKNGKYNGGKEIKHAEVLQSS